MKTWNYRLMPMKLPKRLFNIWEVYSVYDRAIFEINIVLSPLTKVTLQSIPYPCDTHTCVLHIAVLPALCILVRVVYGPRLLQWALCRRVLHALCWITGCWKLPVRCLSALCTVLVVLCVSLQRMWVLNFQVIYNAQSIYLCLNSLICIY